jgi:phage terminase large subunit-like protein
VVDEENSATPESRKKVHDLIHGAIKASLAPESEAPDAKLVMLQTPLDEDDPSTSALKDPSWLSARFPCWTLETEDLPIEQQKSSWPARYSDEVLRRDKRAAILSGRYYIFAREKELKLTSPETAAFHSYKLNRYELAPPREEMKVIMWIDPVPPPSEHQIAKGFARKDFEAMVVVGLWKDRFYLLDVEASRGHQPDWTENTFFQLAEKWRPREIWVESVAYQVTLVYSLRKAMHERRRFYAVHEDNDRRKKYDKIVDGLSGPAKNGQLYVRDSDTTFIEQFEKYPSVNHDDVIEAVARAVEKLNFDNVIEGEYEESEGEEKQVPLLENWRAAP